MNSAETKSYFSVWLIAFLGILVLYVLTPGPLYWLMDRNLISVQFFRNAVFPLQWLYDNNEWIEKFYDWYIPLWR